MKFCLTTVALLIFGNAFVQTTDQTDYKGVIDSLMIRADSALEENDLHLCQQLVDSASVLAEALSLVNTPTYGRTCLIAGAMHLRNANYSDAEKWFLQCTNIFEKEALTDTEYYAECIANLGVLYSDLSKAESAESFLNKALSLYEKRNGKNSTEYAECISNLAHLYYDNGKYIDAEKNYTLALSIRENVSGISSIPYTGSLINLGMVNWKTGHFEKAEKYYLDAKAILEDQMRDTTHIFYKNCLSNLSILYTTIGRYEAAVTMQQKVLSMDERVFGKTHPNYARSLNNLGVTYFRMGQYERTEKLFTEAVQIRKKQLGSESLDYASSLHNLATVQNMIGEWDKAEIGYITALQIRKKALGEKHPDYGISLNNLAGFYKNLGDREKADSLYRSVLELFRETFGETHPDYLTALNNYAGLNFSTGYYDIAATHYKEFIEKTKQSTGASDPDYAQGYHYLAKVYHIKGDLENAWIHYDQAEQLLKPHEKSTPLAYAEILQSLGEFYMDSNDIERAEYNFTQSANIRKNLLGVHNELYGQSMQRLADVMERKGKFEDTERLLEAAMAIKRKSLSIAQSFLSQKELTKFAATFQNDGNQIGRFLLSRYSRNIRHEELTGQFYNYALYYKGFILTSVSRLNALTTISGEAKDLNIELRGYSRQLAAALAKPVEMQQGVLDLEDKVNQTEKKLARIIAGYDDNIRQVEWRAVQAALDTTEVAIEFVHFRDVVKSGSSHIMYAALLIRPDKNHPYFIPLFEENAMAHLSETDNERKADYVNDLYAWSERGMVKLGAEKKSLYTLIWEKIEAMGLADVKTIYYAPSGVLHRINLGAIPVDDESILSDRYNLVAMNSTRQLVIPFPVKMDSKNALLVGGVNFEVETTQPERDDQPLLASRSASETQGTSATRGGSWSYLKWTEKEVQRIFATIAPEGYQVDTLSGSNAKEENVKTIGTGKSSPRILHIATHGFFFSDSEQRSATPLIAEPVFKWSDNPMIRSGLILAGGNYAWQHGRAPHPDMEDGILTAYEISQMNLSNTELVVLSACETGLGDIQGNEGVYGLQRAFKIAGAKYLIMSLWQVPDRETMEFMTTFYKNWLEGKMTIPDAFRKTQREMRDRFFNPYSWAGFVLVE